VSVQYFIVEEGNVTNDMIERMQKHYATDFTSLRRSDPALNPLKFSVEVLLKYKWGTAPVELFNTGVGPYTQEEIDTIISEQPEWGET